VTRRPERPLTEIERIEREEFARGHIQAGAPAVTPRPAATIILARQRGEPFEILLLQRPLTSRFAAGAYVFPGGVIDPEDGDPMGLPRLQGSPDALVGDLERAALVAALRELFEETGVLLSDRHPAPAELQTARARMLAGGLSFRELVQTHGLTFHTIEIAYFARWVTPARLSRRYDTHFFMAVGHGEDPDLTPEHTDYRWISPTAALEAFHSGRLPMLYPTVKTMEALARFDDLTDAFDDFSARPVEPIFARLIVRGDDIKPVMPGDPDYDEGE